MIKPLIAAVIGIALGLGGAYGVMGQFGDSGPSVVASVTVAPLGSGQESQAKLAPLDQGLIDTSFDNLQAATNQIAASLESSKTAPSTQVTGNLQNDVQNFVNQVQNTVQNNQQSQFVTSNNQSSTSQSTSSTNNGVTTTTTSTTTSPSNVAVVTTTTTPSTASPAALAQAVDAYNQVVAKVTALDLPADIKAELLDFLSTLRTQLLAMSIPDQVNAVQTLALTNNGAVDALNSFLNNVNTLNMTPGDKAKTFAALLASLSGVPGVNTNFATVAPPITTQMVTSASNVPNLTTQIQTQIQTAMNQAMANLDAQRKLAASLQGEGTNAFNTSQFGLNAQDFTNTVFGSLNMPALIPAR